MLVLRRSFLWCFICNCLQVCGIAESLCLTLHLPVLQRIATCWTTEKVLVNNYECPFVPALFQSFIYLFEDYCRYTIKEWHCSSGIFGTNRKCDLRLSDKFYKMDYLSGRMCYLWIFTHETRD